MDDENTPKPRPALSRTELAASADGLRALLRAIEAGEIEANAGQVAHLEGSLATLDGLLGNPSDT